jgi:hypothetical protein
MGSWFTYFNIANDDLDEEKLKSRINGMFAELGYTPAEAEDATREVAIIFSQSFPKWIALYDSDANEVTEDILIDLTRQYSKAFDSAVFVSTVCDSDALLMNLWDAKRNKGDLVICDPQKAYFDPEEYPRRKVKGKPEIWTELCNVPEADAEKLRKIWDNKKYVFTDEQLFDVLEILGVDKELAGLYFDKIMMATVPKRRSLLELKFKD